MIELYDRIKALYLDIERINLEEHNIIDAEKIMNTKNFIWNAMDEIESHSINLRRTEEYKRNYKS